MKKIITLILSFLIIFTSLPVSAQFSDTDNHWAHDTAERMSDKGIITGYNGLFRPDNPITRADLAVILDRLMSLDGAGENKFADLPDAYYTDAVLKLNKAGIIFGYGGYIRPLDNITRQEAAVMIDEIICQK